MSEPAAAGPPAAADPAGANPAAGSPAVADPAAEPAAFYAAGYAPGDPARAELGGRWRALGARTKADHVVRLCARAGLRPATLVEIGCGDGAVLSELAARGVAPVLDGFELSANAIALARRRGIPGRLEAYDGAHVPAADGAYDLALLTHVLEHVADPAALLAEAARVARWVLVEVPLEANRSAARPAKRALAARAGHVQAFDRAAIAHLLSGAGLHPRAELTDPLPYAHHAFFGHRARAALKWAARTALWRLAPRRAERLFTVHFAVLTARTTGE
ncbi:MAG TPA: class I SAM-dependent methyltransferase [Solirubrobacteraceae bacterium]|jgi:SAM-dependent methyltransferase